MPIDPGQGEALARRVSELYADAELGLLRRIARTLAQGMDAPEWAQAKLLQLDLLRSRMGLDLAALDARAVGVIGETVAFAWGVGQATAVQDLDDLDVDVVMPPARARAVQVIAEETIGAVQRVRPAALRAVVDIYQRVVGEASATAILGAETRRTAAQAALDRLAGHGVTGFRDTAGRAWSMESYVEMAVRTGTGKAAVQGHVDQLQAAGLDLVVVSDAPRECALCRPWEGKILSLGRGVAGVIEAPSVTGGAPVRVRVTGTLDDARQAGFQHPNAILGNQSARVLGDIENAARSWYDGPSVHLTTARGHRLTVSPNHPVLTTSGWQPAEAIREGAQVLSRPDGEGVHAAPGAVEDLDDVPATFEQVFDALAAHGYRTRVSPAADDFHGDGRHYEGEVDVVWTERALRDVLEPDLIEVVRELDLAWTGVQLEPLTGLCPQHEGLRGVRRAVRRPLADGHASVLEASPERRLADAVDPGEVLAGLACGVTPDEVIHVERDWYTGHCYDLQTSTGAYLTGDIVVHNCRHSVSAYLPGATRRRDATAEPTGYVDQQRQRAIERNIRTWKTRSAIALDDGARATADAKVREWQAAMRQHLAAHPDLKRQGAREQIGRAR